MEVSEFTNFYGFKVSMVTNRYVIHVTLFGINLKKFDMHMPQQGIYIIILLREIKLANFVH